MKNYKHFKIETDPFNIDLLSGYLWELEILGINEYDNYLSVFVNDDDSIGKKDLEKLLIKLKNEILINSFKISEEILLNKNWNEEWEKSINIIEVSDRIIIKPSFRKYDAKENQIIITIDPKMSFGTGEHQTTRIVINLLEEYLNSGNTVLDVGSGTSVLGIVASKLGATNVVAVDNDEWCYLNGIENVARNNETDIKVLHGTIDDIEESNFNLVLANINKNVLIEIKDKLFNKLNVGGFLILSGILKTDEDEIKRQFTQIGLTALKCYPLDEWIGIVFTKTD